MNRLIKFIVAEKKYITLFIVVVVATVAYIHPAVAQTTTNETTSNEIITTNESTDIDSGLPSSDTEGTNDYFLKIDGIPGESKVRGHEQEIELESFSWGLSQQGTSNTGGGSGAGKVAFDVFRFRSLVSKASPLLFLHTANGKHIKQVTLTVRKKGEKPQDYYIVKMSDVVISSYHSVGNNGAVPLDKVSLNYAKIEFEYKVQKEDGSLDAPIKAGWDLKANKGI